MINPGVFGNSLNASAPSRIWNFSDEKKSLIPDRPSSATMSEGGCSEVANMIDLKKESAITLAEVPLHVPRRNGRKVHYSTVYRWVTKGARGRRLESLLVGGVRYTTIEAIGRFLRTDFNAQKKQSSADKLNSAIDEALKEAGV